MTDSRVHMGTRAVWRWYFRPPIDSYTTANWHRLPRIRISGREQVAPNSPSRLAGRRIPFVSIAFHKRCWRIPRLPWEWRTEVVLDFIEENGGWPIVPNDLSSITEEET